MADLRTATKVGQNLPVMMPKAAGDRSLFREMFQQKLAAGDQAVIAADVLNRAAMNTAETGFQMHPADAAILDRASAALASRTRVQAETAPANDKAAADGRAVGSLGIMREAAARTASEMGTTSTMGASGPSPSGPAGMGPDGQTEAYTRMQNGHSVFVRGYSTPGR